MNRETDIRFLKGVGEKRAQILNKMGIDTVGALLRFYPRAYEDWNASKSISECEEGVRACIRGRIITTVDEHYIRAKMVLYKFVAQDANGTRMTVTLFNNKYLAQSLHKDCEYLFYGKISEPQFFPAMSSPEIRTVGSAGIHPVYPATGALSSKAIEKLVATALQGEALVSDPLPPYILEKNGLCDLHTAIRQIHFPQSTEALERAKRRLIYEEFFLLQTTLLILKTKHRTLTGNILPHDYTAEFRHRLPFELTSAQQRAIEECAKDLSQSAMMNRLLQGDVGSGKTAVAAALAYSCAKNGFQAALMAPTEILAEQHYATLSSFFEGTDVRCTLLTGSTKKKEKVAIKQALCDGTVQVAVGTHALLTQDVAFRDLALAITDEQHRFGVEQRANLSRKGKNPHTLVMSATPIPRTLAMMLYGDLDISILDEYPKGRQKIESYCVDGSYHERLYRFVKKHLDAGRQGYIVCPLVEDSEEMSPDLHSAEAYYETLRTSAFKDYKVGLLHGKMNARDKESVMRAFKDGEVQLLICTTVVEVGVDVPNATVMIIENAERFGLSQLHQLRGRIGRGTYASTCVFVTEQNGPVAERLKVICNSNDGFYIAEEDLKLRGPGDFIGRRQHGLPEFRIADLSTDLGIFKTAASDAADLLMKDEKLTDPANKALRAAIQVFYQKMNNS
ncbi:MAG: ATP-dependent DNA helicase RecG [Clostridia bacterium]|nr:ATP-dependent DNA helicase RecG [Clostridia bacterium]